jgi:hypothetical protein
MGRSVPNTTGLPNLSRNTIPSLPQLVPPALRTPAGFSLTNQRTTTLLPNAPRLPRIPTPMLRSSGRCLGEAESICKKQHQNTVDLSRVSDDELRKVQEILDRARV